MKGIDCKRELGLSFGLGLRFDEQRIVPQVVEQRVDNRGFAVPHKTLEVGWFRALYIGGLVALNVDRVRLGCEFVEERWI